MRVSRAQPFIAGKSDFSVVPCSIEKASASSPSDALTTLTPSEFVLFSKRYYRDFRVDARSAQGVTSLDLLDHERCACQLPFMTVLFTYQSASNTCKYPENIGAREQQRVERRPHLSFAVSFARVCAIGHQIVAIGSGVNFILSNPFFSFL